ncbi:hypothetical protein BDR07DRAFT_1379434 [Suillus spraguei]|nr:hypothetical protein BDR07DRAFT_1379434 [Suillus spraguei]
MSIIIINASTINTSKFTTSITALSHPNSALPLPFVFVPTPFNHTQSDHGKNQTNSLEGHWMKLKYAKDFVTMILYPPQQSQFCIICRDGSVDKKYLLLCNESQCQAGDDLTPYLGFYRNNKPVLNLFLPIRAALEINMMLQLSSDNLLFIHLTLVDYDTAGGLFELGHQFLMPYFPNSSMEYHKVTFDIGTASKVSKYEDSMAALVGKLSSSTWECVVFGYDRKTYVATPVHDSVRFSLVIVFGHYSWTMAGSH